MIETRQACAVDGCSRRHWAKGFCSSHYRQHHRGHIPGPFGPRLALGERRQQTCSVPGCNNTHRRNGFCTPHSHIQRVYGINPAEFETLLEGQDGKCAICRTDCELNPRLSVDHDHETGVVRGLLCNRCNVGLGRFREDPELLKRAAGYLERSRAKGGAACA